MVVVVVDVEVAEVVLEVVVVEAAVVVIVVVALVVVLVVEVVVAEVLLLVVEVVAVLEVVLQRPPHTDMQLSPIGQSIAGKQSKYYNEVLALTQLTVQVQSLQVCSHKSETQYCKVNTYQKCSHNTAHCNKRKKLTKTVSKYI